MSRRTNDEIYLFLEGELLPRLDRVEALTTKNHAILKEAGLVNGDGSHAVKAFFDDRAARLMVQKALTQPLRKGGRIFLLVLGAVSTLAWAILGSINIIRALFPGH